MAKSDFAEYVERDLFSGIQGIRVKAMFGGYGVYKKDVMFAIIVDDELYFKVDKTNQKDFEKLGSRPFVYQSKNRSVTMSYWKVPAEILDDLTEVEKWAEKSYRIGLKSRKHLK